MNSFMLLLNSISLKNKYTRWYFGIIQIAQKRNLKEYTEKHHILPKSFKKALQVQHINLSENLVNLTPREHFICHKLLTKMFEGDLKRKMSYALHRIMHSDNGKKIAVHKVSSRQYELFRKQHSENLKGPGNPMFNRKHSDETKLKISMNKNHKKWTDKDKARMSEQRTGEKNGMYGKTHTDEVRKLISKNNAGKRTGGDNYFFGKEHTAETKRIMSEKRRSQPKHLCQFCKKLVDPSNFARWHGNNCKFGH